ncbi:hypothetical protein [Flavobacterium sp.]|uniref:hypothetical protein n=1 Tax=Flavobacterium sp. TaxID=239 RepID=UPI003D6BA9E9
MSERKNIERLFQEKFKDFEVNPPQQVWGNIESKLEKKETKATGIPFWLKASGIAAILLLGYFTADNYSELNPFKSTEKNTETVVSSESSNEIKNKGSQEGTANENVEKNQISNQENTVVVNENVQNNESSNLKTNHLNSSEERVVSSENGNSNKNDNKTGSFGKTGKSKRFNVNDKDQFQQNTDNGIAVVSDYKKIKNKRSNASQGKESVASVSYNENQFTDQNSKKTNRKVKKEPFASDENQSIANNSQIIMAKLSKDLIEKTNSANNIFINEGKNSTAISKAKQNSNIDKSMPFINEGKNSSMANFTNLIGEVAKDSAIVVVVQENPLEKILKEKESKDKDKEDKKVATSNLKWKVRPTVAPIFMSSSKGSPIDNQFRDNAKEYENNLSVGLGVDYVVTSKISLRTGISKLDLGYNTKDIVYYEDLNSRGLESKTFGNVNLRPEARGIVVEDENTSPSQEVAFQNKEEGYLNQQMNYMEIPVEVSYKLIDKKFGLQLITGLSTLFLNENKVSVVSNGFSTTLGEANNLSKVHFSTNIGLGLKYSFWKSFEANFEPTFKYQINTFNENSGGFKPYIIGLYTGISFRF